MTSDSKSGQEIGLRSHTQIVKRLATAVILLTVAIASYTIITRRLWQRWRIETSWCQKTVDAAHPLIDSLETFHKDTGSLPHTLDELTPRYLSHTPDVPFGESESVRETNWGYHCESRDQFSLCVSTQHWVSSYDALIYRSSRDYSDIQGNENVESKVIGDWIYVIGAQHIKSP